MTTMLHPPTLGTAAVPLPRQGRNQRGGLFPAREIEQCENEARAMARLGAPGDLGGC